MGDEREFGPDDVRLMQRLAAEVWSVAPELVNAEATVGELAWIFGKDNAALGKTWLRRFWTEGGEVVGWGWIYLPHRVRRSDGGVVEFQHASLVWQVRPDRPELLDEILDWYDGQVPGTERRTGTTAANADSMARLAAHGYVVDERTAADDGFWTQFNARDLADLPDPELPDGFRFRTADEVGPEAAVGAHRDAWHPSSFTEEGFAGVRRMWPYRGDLHVLLEAPDGTLAATAIMWLDEHNRTAEFEPVGTHQGYRRRGLSGVLLRHGMHRAREAGATRMLVACLGGAAYPAARGLYYGIGFHELSRDAPYRRPA